MFDKLRLPEMPEISGFVQEILGWAEHHPAVTGLASVFLLAVLGFVVNIAQKIVASISRPMRARYANHKNRLTVEPIRNSRKPQFQEFVDVYHELFEESERTATSEISAWVDGKRKELGIGYKIFLVRKERKAIGFGIVTFNESKQMAFIPYVGMLGDANRWSVSKEATSEFFKALSSALPSWRFVLVELDDPEGAGNEKTERLKRLARIKLFKQHCELTGLSFRQVPFQYIHPPFHTDGDDSDLDAMRLCIITRKNQNSIISSNDAYGIIEFLYNDIYLRCIWRDAPSGSKYVDDIAELLVQYKTLFVGDIKLREHYDPLYEILVV
jgi:hypothetical protein